MLRCDVQEFHSKKDKFGTKQRRKGSSGANSMGDLPWLPRKKPYKTCSMICRTGGPVGGAGCLPFLISQAGSRHRGRHPRCAVDTDDRVAVRVCDLNDLFDIVPGPDGIQHQLVGESACLFDGVALAGKVGAYIVLFIDPINCLNMKEESRHGRPPFSPNALPAKEFNRQ